MDAIEDGVEPDVLLAGEVLVQAGALEDDPDLRRTALASLTRSNPAIVAWPSVGRRVVVRIEIVVVLPAPFGPSRAKNSPPPTSKEIPSTAFRSAFR